jgi:hypothetical protein
MQFLLSLVRTRKMHRMYYMLEAKEKHICISFYMFYWDQPTEFPCSSHSSTLE